jgi:hypothetical protein
VKILFLHGWHSVPGGVKPTFLAQHGHEVINPKLPDEDFSHAVTIALCKIASKERRHLLDIGGSALFPKNLSALQR